MVCEGAQYKPLGLVYDVLILVLMEDGLRETVMENNVNLLTMS